MAATPRIKSISLLESLIAWPTKNDKILVRIDPRLIGSFGLTSGKDGEKPGWIVWCSEGGNQYMHFEEKHEDAFRLFERIRIAKAVT